MTAIEARSKVGSAYRKRSRTYRPPLHTHGAAWGPTRVRLGVSMRDLEKRSGVNRWILSLAEQGRLIPAGEEFDAVMAVLNEVEASAREAQAGNSSTGEPGPATVRKVPGAVGE